MTDRRNFLKLGTTAVAAAVIPGIPTSETTAVMADVVATSPATIVPVKLSPYANYVWEWFVSHDGATYYEGFPTKEEAFKYAQQCDYSIIAECVQQDFDLSMPGWRIIEQLNDDNMELCGEGEGIECTPEQERDLEAMVTKAIEAWVVKHSINITALTFNGTRNETEVPLPETQGQQT